MIDDKNDPLKPQAYPPGIDHHVDFSSGSQQDGQSSSDPADAQYKNRNAAFDAAYPGNRSFGHDGHHPADPYPPDDGNPRGKRRKKGMIVLLSLISALLLLTAAVYFLLPESNTGIIGTINQIKNKVSITVVGVIEKAKSWLDARGTEPLEVLAFKASSQNIYEGDEIDFTILANQTVESVRLQDSQGNEVAGEAASFDSDHMTWTIHAVFYDEFSGDLYPALLQDGKWIVSDKSKYIVIQKILPTLAPTGIPTPIPSMTPLAAAIPTEKPTDTPVPTARPTNTPAPTAKPTNTPVPTARPTDTPAPTARPTNTPVPTARPTSTPAPTARPTDTPAPTASPTNMSALTARPTNTPEPITTPSDTPKPTIMLYLLPTPSLSPTQTAAPSPSPSPSPSPTDVPMPTPTQIPALKAAAADSTRPELLGVIDTVFKDGVEVSTFTRDRDINMPKPDQYAVPDGIFAFRGDAFRQNAFFGSANIIQNELSIVWRMPLGYLETKDAGPLYGVGWTGQPAIIDWPDDMQMRMNIYEEKKAKSSLKEVIIAAQDGKVYFADLEDGSATRPTINIGYPLKGSVAVDPRGMPVAAFGQAISVLPKISGEIGFHLYSLFDSSRLLFINGRRSTYDSQYSTNGAFDGSALFDISSDHMIIAGENGLLYTIKLNANIDSHTNMLTLDPEIITLKSKAGAQTDSQVGIEGSAAVYGRYIYLADTYGFLRCVDSGTMQTIWAVDVGDNTDAAPALDLDNDDNLSLYTGNTVFNRVSTAGEATIRRLDALTGQEIWSSSVGSLYSSKQLSGCKASPVIGQNKISDLVIFTVNMTQTGSSVLAFDKATGSVVWRADLMANTVSSPVAVYNDQGKAWLIQADETGVIHLLDARTGEHLNSLALDGEIQASPAVYNDMLLIATCSRDNAYLYGILIK